MRALTISSSLLVLVAVYPAVAGADVTLRSSSAATNTTATVCPAPGTNPQPIHGEACTGACEARINELCKSAGALAPTSTAPLATGAPWQSLVIGGLSDFLADRTKAEVIAWVEDLVGDKLCAMTYREVTIGADGVATVGKDQKWFPGTCQILSSPDYGVEKSTGMLAAAIRDDLRGLPKAIGYYATEQAVKKYAETHPKQPADATLIRLVSDFHAALSFIDDLRSGKSPLIAVANLGHSNGLRDQCRINSAPASVAPECGPVLGGLLVEYLGAIVTQANVDSGNTAGLEKLVANVFHADSLCLDVIHVFDSTELKCNVANTHVPAQVSNYLKLLVLAQIDYDTYYPRIERIARAMVSVEAKVEAIRKGRLSTANLSDLDTTIQELVDAGFGLFDQKAAKFDEVMAVSRELLTVVGDFQSGDYMAGGRAGIQLIADVEGNLGVAIPAKLKRFLAFTMDLASAKSSQDVTGAFDSLADPVGGWKIKQEHCEITIGALVGALGGFEWPRKGELPDGMSSKVNGGAAGGLFAPVGFDLSTPLSQHHESLGLFFSVIDVGQLTWARLTNVTDTTNDIKADPAPTTDFGQVFSPGAYLHVSLGHSPLVFGGGVSYAPSLRKYTIGAGTAGAPMVDELSTLRVGVFLAVDVTILPLWAGGD